MTGRGAAEVSGEKPSATGVALKIFKNELDVFFFSSRRRHTRSYGDWSSDVCSSDLPRVSAASCRPGRASPSTHRPRVRRRRHAGHLRSSPATRSPRRVLSRDTASRHRRGDRKSTRLNSSHRTISYAVFCLKKKQSTLLLGFVLRNRPICCFISPKLIIPTGFLARDSASHLRIFPAIDEQSQMGRALV